MTVTIKALQNFVHGALNVESGDWVDIEETTASALASRGLVEVIAPDAVPARRDGIARPLGVEAILVVPKPYSTKGE